MRSLSVEEVHSIKVEELGLDPEIYDLSSSEAIACAFKRIANILCPCTSSTLVREIIEPLRGLVQDIDEIKESANSILESMIAYGDFLEQLEDNETSGYNTRLLLNVAPQRFILRESGTAILIGSTPEQRMIFPEALQNRIEYINHVRRLSPLDDEDLKVNLIQIGLYEISYSYWLNQPSDSESPSELVSRIDEKLDSKGPSGEIPGLSILDRKEPVTYYTRRWKYINLEYYSGRFVCRRPQAYGADLWCYVELSKGIPKKLLDLPLESSSWRGCDEAWRLQAAIDYLRGSPQEYRIREESGGKYILDFFSPVPMWATRRWDAIGEKLAKPLKCLFSYQFNEKEVSEEINYIKEKLWLKEID